MKEMAILLNGGYIIERIGDSGTLSLTKKKEEKNV